MKRTSTLIALAALTAVAARVNTSAAPLFQSEFTADKLTEWTIIDANDDGDTWALEGNEVSIRYNPDLDMDDWLITPQLQMQAGKAYRIDLKMYCNTHYNEIFELKCGTDATVEAMTGTLIEPTTIRGRNIRTFSKYFIPPTDGTYYLGVHGISLADMSWMWVNGLTVGEAELPTLPMAPIMESYTVNSQNTCQTTIKVVAPDKNIAGGDLSSLTKLEVYRKQDTLVAPVTTFENPVPGDTLTFTDEVPVMGYYTYTFVAYNEDGSGPKSENQIKVGYGKPVSVANVDVFRTGNYGETRVSWSPVEYDINGFKYQKPCTYTVYRLDHEYYNEYEVADGVSDTTIVDKFDIHNPFNQKMVSYMVYANYQDEERSDVTHSDIISVGNPISDLIETFDNGRYDLPWALTSNNCNIETVDEEDADGPETSNDDGSGFIRFKGADNSESTGAISSLLVSLEGMKASAFMFDIYNVYAAQSADDPDWSADAVDSTLVEVAVRTEFESEWTRLYSNTVDNLCGDRQGWSRVVVDMPAYNDSVVEVQLSVKFRDVPLKKVLFDHIMLGDNFANNLKVKSLTGPLQVKAGKPLSLETTVNNSGMNQIDAYTLQLYADGKLIEEAVGDTLEVGRNASHTFDVIMSPFAVDSVSYFVKAICAVDDNLDDNLSDTLNIKVIASNLPKVSNLTADKVEGVVNLTWVAPEYTEQGEFTEITEGFEYGRAYDTTYGDWTFIDGDQSPISFHSDCPKIISGETKGSFWIWDVDAMSNYSNGKELIIGHTSKKFLFSLYRNDAEQVDDWAISPQLSGEAQTVKFYATSYYGSYPELLEVLYSTADTVATEDFVCLEGWPVELPEKWIQYNVDLPEGATYVAFRNRSTDAYRLFIDDVTFTPANFPRNLVLAGYNIYRNGEKLNPLPVQECTFADEPAESATTNLYTVTAVYEKHGESAGVNYELISTGVEGVAADRHVTIAQQGGYLVISNAEGLDITVAAPSGMVLYQGRATSQRTAVSVVPGVYIVRAGSAVAKIVVK